MTWDEVEELACLMLGKDYDSIIDNDLEFTIYDMFYEEYDITLKDFEYLLKSLVKFTNPWKSYITGDVYRGFVTNTETEGIMRAIIKEKV